MQEKTLVVIITLILLALSFGPAFYEISQAPKLDAKNRVFVLEHNWPYDFYAYVAKMEQGARGAWLVKDPFTTELHKGSLIQIFFLLLGKVGAWFRLSTITTYHLARFLFGGSLLLATYLFLRRLFDSSYERIMAFLILGLSGGFPKFIKSKGILKIGHFMETWTVEDNLQRITFLPHHLFGQTLLVAILILLTKAQKQKSPRFSLLAGLLGLILGIVFPPCLVVAYTTWGIYLFLESIANLSTKKQSWFKEKGRYFIVFLGISLPSLVYTFLMTRIYPWKVFADYESRRGFALHEYPLALGAAFFAGVVGMFLVIWQRKRKFFLSISWIWAVFFLILVSYYFPNVGARRFSQARVSIPFAILSVYLLVELANIFGKKRRLALAILAILFLVPSIISATASLNWQINFIDTRVRAVVPLVPYPPQIMYPNQDWYQAIIWLKNNTHPDEVVLAEVTAGNLIPAYSGNTVYFGHAETMEFRKKEKIVKKFFAHLMDNAEALNLLEANRIKYVFFGPQGRQAGKKTSLAYPFLKTIFKNKQVIIYRFEETL